MLEKLAAEDVNDFAQLILIHSRKACPVDTGNLKRSLVKKVLGPKHIVLQSRTGYGGYVHFGTRRMQPQPYFAHGTDAAIGPMEDLIRNKARGR